MDIINSNTLIYLIKVSICLSLLYAIYHFTLRRETNFRSNRVYLLLSLVISFTIPLLSLFNILLPEALPFAGDVFEGINVADQTGLATVKEIEPYSINIWSVISVTYLSGCLILAIRLLFQLFRITKTLISGKVIRLNNSKIHIVKEDQAPFSFFNRIVIDKKTRNSKNLNNIIEHEKMHKKSLHTIDNIIAETVATVLWFNPVIYLLKKSLIENNEFMADEMTIQRRKNSVNYMESIIDVAYSNSNGVLVNSFCSTTKKRIIMITKNRSNKFSYLKYMLAIPVVSLSLFAFAGNTNVNNTIKEVTPAISNVIVQDNSVPDGKPIKSKDLKRISNRFGKKLHPIKKKMYMHNGIDIAAKEGTPVYATGDGVIKKTGQDKGRGIYIMIVHNDQYQTNYTHLSKVKVTEGKKVKKGDIIGYVGNTGMSTGSHLHYEIVKDKKNIDPLTIIKGME